ncbi:MAG: DNA translocase FtsK 4TM domain-containing protein [Methylococcales bacterium]|nr:DNA translocase FtsK 4TM domain-containing protein [Methylococcales bacterium]
MSAVMEEKTFRGMREVALLSVIAGALFFLISLITFNNDDAGWTHSGSIKAISNAGGVFGAWISDFMLSFFGLCAYTFPLIIIWQGYLTYSNRRPEQSGMMLTLHWLGAIATIISADALFSFYFQHTGLELPRNTGGILGQEVGAALAVIIGSSGATLFLLVVLFAGLRLVTEISVLSVLDFIGKHSFSIGGAFYRNLLEALHANAPKPATMQFVAETEKPVAKRQRAKVKPVVEEETFFDEEDDDDAAFDELLAENEDDEEKIEVVEKKSVKKSKAKSAPVPLDSVENSDKPAKTPLSKKFDKLVETVKHVKDEMLEQAEKAVEKVEKKAAKKPAEKKPKAIVYPKKNKLPTLDLLDDRDTKVIGYSQSDLEEMSRLVEDILADFNVSVTVVGFHPGPVITRFELQLAAGVKVSRISSLSKDLARSLSVTSVRIVEIIPGKPVVGLEIPNREREMVTLRELLKSAPFEKSKSLLTLAMGKDIAGVPICADLGKMPHALVAGTTGSGKSVAINTMILSLLYKANPDQVRLIMIDPKMLELSVYEDIPHLLTPVVTDMKEASNALRWAVGEMERRYKLMSKMGVRNLAGFNQVIEDAAARGETIRAPMFQMINPLEDDEDFPTLSTLPSIVIVIDELADMMMIVGKKVEELIARLAQKARAAGIHLILATQRPSVDVLTGLIKANVPTRISFQVSSRIDSRTILDQGGAETLLGNGDMLFLPSGTSIPIRAHGAFVDDHEVHRVVEFLKQTGPTNYLKEILQESSDSSDSFGGGNSYGGGSESDPLYDEAVRFVTESRKASISSVQRRFKVGYNRAATMIEDMENAGVVSSPESNGTRVVLAPPVA